MTLDSTREAVIIHLTRLKTILHVIAAAAFLATIAPASAQDLAPYKVAGGFAIYLGVIPAEIVTGHPKGHTEAEMHGGVSSERHAHHVMLAIFDAASGQRIIDATVEARVAGPGLAGTRKVLEPMTIADAMTYGNYFDLPGRDRYRIQIEITRPGEARPVQVEFEYDHQS